MQMVKETGVERHLHRRELSYMDDDGLHSMSNKTLGELRQAARDNKHLTECINVS